MSTSKARKASSKNKSAGQPERCDPYQKVTELILEHLEKGTVPWRRPWNREVGRPRNLHTGKPYQGVNVLLLGCRFAASPWWLTYRQAAERGGYVRRGEHGTMVIKYGTFERKAGDNPAEPDQHRPDRKGIFLRTFTVFNASQIEGIEFPRTEPEPPLFPDRRLEAAEAIVRGMKNPPVIRDGSGVCACYRPSIDEIEMPPFRRFTSGEAYFLTLFHELSHASGHPSRLNRETLTGHDGFGGKVYSLEELTAEMGAAFLGMEANIVQDRHEQSAAYLNGWLSVLKVKEHRRWIVQAAGHAARAADHILGRTGGGEESAPEPD